MSAIVQIATAPKVPWLLPFHRKDLLAACWGSKKGADLLYHFLHRASWERKNQNFPETLKDIKFQESTPKALEKSGLSLGSFHTYLKHFVSVGYISTEAYTGEYTIHINAIEQAFSKAPEKPVSETCKRRQPSTDSFNLKDCNFVTLTREDHEMLMELKDECFKLKEMFQSLKHSHAQMLAELKEMFQSLKQNPTIHTTQEADAGVFSEPQSNDLRVSLEDDIEEEGRGEREESSTPAIDATASSPAPDTHSQVSPDEDRTLEATAYQPEKIHIASATTNTQGELNGLSDHTSHHRLRAADPDLMAGRGDMAGPASNPRSASTQTKVASAPAQAGGYTQATLTAVVEKPVSAHVEQMNIKKLSLQAHTDCVFRWLEEIKQEAKRDKRVGYVKNPTSEKLIKALITACWNTDKELTRENVRKAWRQMWNSKPGKDGFTWKKAGISIDAYCRHYGEELEKAWDDEGKEQEPAPVPAPTATTPTVSGLRRWVPPSQAQTAFAQ